MPRLVQWPNGYDGAKHTWSDCHVMTVRYWNMAICGTELPKRANRWDVEKRPYHDYEQVTCPTCLQVLATYSTPLPITREKKFVHPDLPRLHNLFEYNNIRTDWRREYLTNVLLTDGLGTVHRKIDSVNEWKRKNSRDWNGHKVCIGSVSRDKRA